MDDLISRKAVLNEIRKVECEPGYQHQGEDWAVGLCIAESIVEGAESAEPERKKGRWIYDTERVTADGFVHSQYHCSNCGYQVTGWIPNYCQYCGADMRGE